MLRVLKRFFATILILTFASQASAMFIQPDWFDPTDPKVGTNRYAYSHNDPINNSDPNGNQSWLDPIPGIAHDNVIVGGGLIIGGIAGGIGIMAGRPGSIVNLPPCEQRPPFLDNPNKGLTPSGEVIGIDIVSTPEAGSGGIIVSTPDGQVIELPNYVEARGNILKPDPGATGAHTTPKCGPEGKITGYQEWVPNPKNPTGFDAGRRVDVTGKPHTNKDGTRVPTPHVHEPGEKDVRPAEPDELPK